MNKHLLPSFGTSVEGGVDEAGRGALAGGVFAAAVILPKNFLCPGLRDSKKLSPKQRYQLRQVIIDHAICYSICSIEVEAIDQINILNATFEAMNQAIIGLSQTPELLLIDGNRFKNQTDIPFHTIVKGDDTYLSIAAASVLAKTERDTYMDNLDKLFPHYGWAKNRGYGTKQHIEAIAQYGLCSAHRKTFCTNFVK